MIKSNLNFIFFSLNFYIISLFFYIFQFLYINEVCFYESNEVNDEFEIIKQW